MKKLLLIALALGVAQAQASTLDYVCKEGKTRSMVKVDETQNTLSWKGVTYSIKVAEDCGRYGWHAEKDGVGFDFCTATKGVADFEFNGKTVICDMKR